MKIARRWRQLAPVEKLTLVAVAALSLLFRSALLVLPWAATQRLAARRIAKERDDSALARIVWAAEVCERRVRWLTCLSQSLAVRWLLAGAGIAADVQLGAYRDGEAMHFHATVVCAGQPVYGAREMSSLAVVP